MWLSPPSGSLLLGFSRASLFSGLTCPSTTPEEAGAFPAASSTSAFPAFPTPERGTEAAESGRSTPSPSGRRLLPRRFLFSENFSPHIDRENFVLRPKHLISPSQVARLVSESFLMSG